MKKERKLTKYLRSEDKRELSNLTEFQFTRLSEKDNPLCYAKDTVKIK